MAQSFPETSHLNIDRVKYGENYDRIFNKYKCNCHIFEDRVCNICRESTPEPQPEEHTPDTSASA